MESTIPDFIKPLAPDKESRLTAYKYYKHLSRISKFIHGNHVQVYSTGHDYFKSLCKHIDNAKKRIWIEMYIADGSLSSREFFDRLIAASKRGCDVVVILDYFGSIDFPTQWKDELQTAGVNIHYFNPPFPKTSSISFFTFRNHRKLIITDDTAFCGSSNISHASLNKLIEGDHVNHEFGVKVNGPIVSELGKTFISTLEIGKLPIYRDPFQVSESFEDGSLIQILESNPKARKKTIQEAFKYMLKNAENGVFIASSYFIPAGVTRRMLLDVKKRQVPLHLLLSGRSDIYCDVNSTIHVANKLMSRFTFNNDKLRIYLTNKWHFHGKVMTIDDLWTSIGTFNMDRTSSRRNMEISLGILDYRIAKKVKEMQLYYSSPTYSDQFTFDTTQKLSIFNRFTTRVCHYCAKHFGSARLLDWFVDEGFKNKFRHVFIRTFIEDNVGNMMATYSNILGM